MSILNEVDIAIAAVQNILNFIEKVDPAASKNPIFQDLKKAVDTLKELGV